jgi:hypothetical protein
MRRITSILAVAVWLVLAGDALAGCWATVGISPLPTDVAAGERWNVDVRVLQHGRTPLADATPKVVIANAKTGETRSFAASGRGDPGMYQAAVVFPAAGDWSVAVGDGFPVPECAQTHTFGTFVIGPSATPPGHGGSSLWPVVGGALGALAAAVLVVVTRRRRSPRTAAGT